MGGGIGITSTVSVELEDEFVPVTAVLIFFYECCVFFFSLFTPCAGLSDAVDSVASADCDSGASTNFLIFFSLWHMIIDVC